MHTHPSRFIHLFLLIAISLGLLFAPAQPGRAAASSVRTPAGILIPSGVLTPAEFDCAAVTEIPLSECQALVAFYNAVGGSNYWFSDNTPCSGWWGILCWEGHVQRIFINGQGLRGDLPPEIGDLTYLTELELGIILGVAGTDDQYNFITSVPPEIGNLVNLQFLNLSGNQLTSLPPEIGNLVNLQRLELGKNQLASLPPEIGNLVNLRSLSIWDNQLTSLPPEIGNLVNLEYLEASANQLTSLPSEFGNLVNLVTIGLMDNQLTSLPPEIGSFYKLEAGYFIYNRLSSLPASIVNLPNVYAFSIDYNCLKIDDPVLSAFLDQKSSNRWKDTQTTPPDELRITAVYNDGVDLDWKPIRYTGDGGGYEISYAADPVGPYTVFAETASKNASSIQVRGLPAGAARFIRVRTHSIILRDASEPSSAVHIWSDYAPILSLFDCADVTGIPQGECVALVAIFEATGGPGWSQDIPVGSGDNWLASTTPCTWKGLTCTDGHITEIYLGGVNLSGDLPPEIGDLAYLTSLNLGYYTDIIGPGGITNYFVNSLTSIPPEIGELANLRTLDLSGNLLTSLPAELWQLTGLQSLSLGGSPGRRGLLDSLPEGLQNLTALQSLDLSFGRLSSLPAWLSSLTNLEILSLNSNQLHELPAGFENLVNLHYLHLEYNALHIEDPALILFLDQHAGSLHWREGQTSPPTDLTVTSLQNGEATVSWAPISYTLDGGGYEISHATSPTGTYTVLGETADKTAGSFHASGLPQSAVHYFRLRTHTPPHVHTPQAWYSDNLNDLWSDYHMTPISITILEASQPVSVTLQPTAALNLFLHIPDGQFVSLAIPAGAVTETVTLEFSQPLTATPLLSYTLLGAAFDLTASRGGQPLADFAFQQPVNLSVSYDGAAAAGLHEATLSLYTWDGSAWAPAACGGYQRSAWGNWLSAPICHLSRFALFGQPPAATIYLPVISR